MDQFDVIIKKLDQILANQELILKKLQVKKKTNPGVSWLNSTVKSRK